MCRNHSHIASEITGTVRIGKNTMVEVRVCQPLAVELPCGDKWIRPSGVRLLMPYSMRADLPQSEPAAMVVYYIASSSWGERDTITTPETARKLWTPGGTGETACYTTDTYQTPGGHDDDDIPW